MTPHTGSKGRYNRGCRCQPCRDANAAHSARGRARRYAEAAAGLATFAHGKSGYEHYGCRCDICRGEVREYNRAHRRAA